MSERDSKEAADVFARGAQGLIFWRSLVAGAFLVVGGFLLFRGYVHYEFLPGWVRNVLAIGPLRQTLGALFFFIALPECHGGLLALTFKHPVITGTKTRLRVVAPPMLQASSAALRGIVEEEFEWSDIQSVDPVMMTDFRSLFSIFDWVTGRPKATAVGLKIVTRDGRELRVSDAYFGTSAVEICRHISDRGYISESRHAVHQVMSNRGSGLIASETGGEAGLTCKHCGTETLEGDRNCPHCDRPL